MEKHGPISTQAEFEEFMEESAELYEDRRPGGYFGFCIASMEPEKREATIYFSASTRDSILFLRRTDGSKWEVVTSYTLGITDVYYWLCWENSQNVNL